MSDIKFKIPQPRALMAASSIRYREFTRCGQKPLAGGKVFTYEVNSTTLKTTYRDASGLTPNTNPIILDAAGEADIYLDGAYRIVVKDKHDVVQKDMDNINAWIGGGAESQIESLNLLLKDSVHSIMDPFAKALDVAIAAGAGANGWTDALIQTEDGETQRAINNQNIRCVGSIAELSTIKNPKDGQTVNVKSRNTPIYSTLKPYHGGNTFIFDSSKLNENDGVFVYNGWVAQDHRLTFERCGLVVDANSDQSKSFNSCIRYAIDHKIKSIYFESAGDVYFKNQAIIPASKSSEMGGAFSEITIHADGIVFKPTSDTQLKTLLKIHRKFVGFKGSVTFVGGGTVTKAIQHGLTLEEYNAYNLSGHQLLTTRFKADDLNFLNVETGLEFISGTQSYYHTINKIKGNSVNYLVSFLSSPTGLRDQVTRTYIENIQHTNGVCTLFCESVETLIVPSLFSEWLRIESGYDDTLSYVNGVPTAVYIPDFDKNGLANNRIKIKGVVEYCDLACRSTQITNQIDLVATNMTSGDNANLGIITNNTDRSATTQGIYDLRVKSYNFATYPVSITSNDIALDPTLKSHFPDQSWTELFGTLTLMPSTNQGFANTWNRTEMLYVRFPLHSRGFYTRTGTVEASTNEVWVKLKSEDRFKIANTNVEGGYVLLFPHNINNVDLTYFSAKLESYRGESSVANLSCVYDIEISQAYQSVNASIVRKSGNRNSFGEICIVDVAGVKYVALKKESIPILNVFITVDTNHTQKHFLELNTTATHESSLATATQYTTSGIA